jgi:PGF-CTERM protein
MYYVKFGQIGSANGDYSFTVEVSSSDDTTTTTATTANDDTTTTTVDSDTTTATPTTTASDDTGNDDTTTPEPPEEIRTSGQDRYQYSSCDEAPTLVPGRAYTDELSPEDYDYFYISNLKKGEYAIITFRWTNPTVFGIRGDMSVTAPNGSTKNVDNSNVDYIRYGTILTENSGTESFRIYSEDGNPLCIAIRPRTGVPGGWAVRFKTPLSEPPTQTTTVEPARTVAGTSDAANPTSATTSATTQPTSVRTTTTATETMITSTQTATETTTTETTTTETATTAQPETDTTTAPADTTVADTATAAETGTTETNAPGFTAIAAVIAVLATALLVYRRR